MTSFIFLVLSLIFGIHSAFANPPTKTTTKKAGKKAPKTQSAPPPVEEALLPSKSLDFDFIVTGGYLKVESKFYGDDTQLNPYSNLNHGLGLSAFLPESLVPSPFGLSLYLQGKYMKFSESTDKKMASSKFVDIDYGFRVAIAVIDQLRVEIDLGIATNPVSIRRSTNDFKIVHVPSTMVGTKLVYTLDLPSDWSFTMMGTQYLLGSSMASGVKLREGQGYGLGGQFNIDMHDLGYAYIGYIGTSEQQGSQQGSHRREEDLITFGFSFVMEDENSSENPGS